jgi:hypothetical protein
MLNTQIIKYKTKLAQAVSDTGNESGLPVIVQRMCLAELLGQLDAIVAQHVEQEQAQKEGDKVG